MQEDMQAVRIYQYGGPEQLRLEQVPCPVAGEGEVLVRVHAVGVLPAEWKLRQGLFQGMVPLRFPVILGSAFAGVVVEVGTGVTTFRRGDAVFGRTAQGAYAEYTVASTQTLAHKPASVSFAEAATISGGATTAWSALFENGELQEGQRVLIHGAAGGVGSYAVQFARWKGAHVIGTTSSANVEFVRSLGAETVVDYTTTPFEQVIEGMDFVLETIGGENLRRSLGVVRPGGVLVSLLEQPAEDEAQMYGIRAIKSSAPSPFPSAALLATIVRLIEQGQVQATVARSFPLREIQQAHALSQTGHGRGRIVLHNAD